MRRHDWASEMYRVIDEHQTREFAWGMDDCCRFVARVVDAMTGSTLEAQLSEAYTDEPSALALISAHGGLAGAVSHFLGQPSDVRATRGDVVLFDGGEGDAVGVCIGPKVYAMGPKGLSVVDRSEIRQVWPV